MNVAVGASAPQFTLLDQKGEKWSLKEHRGAPVVLYFYPRDDTPGCTTQSCDIRDNWVEFTELGVEVVGISPDDHHSHAAFAARYELPHTLLADPDRKVLEKYGVWAQKSMYGKKFMGVVRSSVVIDARGKVAAVFGRIKPADQSTKALAVVRDLAQKLSLRQRAEHEGRSMQDVARQAVREYIERTSRRELLDLVLDEELPRYAEALERLGK